MRVTESAHLTSTYIHLQPNMVPPCLNTHEPFSAVVIVNARVTQKWREQVSEWLVESGCLYMMAWGHECSLWDDSVDVANLQKYDWNDIPAHKSIMTTWHDDEPIRDVFFYALFAGFHPEVELSKIFILDISERSREAEVLEMFERAKTEN